MGKGRVNAWKGRQAIKARDADTLQRRWSDTNIDRRQQDLIETVAPTDTPVDEVPPQVEPVRAESTTEVTQAKAMGAAERPFVLRVLEDFKRLQAKVTTVMATVDSLLAEQSPEQTELITRLVTAKIELESQLSLTKRQLEHTNEAYETHRRREGTRDHVTGELQSRVATLEARVVQSARVAEENQRLRTELMVVKESLTELNQKLTQTEAKVEFQKEETVKAKQKARRQDNNADTTTPPTSEELEHARNEIRDLTDRVTSLTEQSERTAELYSSAKRTINTLQGELRESLSQAARSKRDLEITQQDFDTAQKTGDELERQRNRVQRDLEAAKTRLIGLESLQIEHARLVTKLDATQQEQQARIETLELENQRLRTEISGDEVVVDAEATAIATTDGESAADAIALPVNANTNHSLEHPEVKTVLQQSSFGAIYFYDLESQPDMRARKLRRDQVRRIDRLFRSNGLNLYVVLSFLTAQRARSYGDRLTDLLSTNIQEITADEAKLIAGDLLELLWGWQILPRRNHGIDLTKVDDDFLKQLATTPHEYLADQAPQPSATTEPDQVSNPETVVEIEVKPSEAKVQEDSPPVVTKGVTETTPVVRERPHPLIRYREFLTQLPIMAIYPYKWEIGVLEQNGFRGRQLGRQQLIRIQAYLNVGQVTFWWLVDFLSKAPRDHSQALMVLSKALQARTDVSEAASRLLANDLYELFVVWHLIFRKGSGDKRGGAIRADWISESLIHEWKDYYNRWKSMTTSS